MDYYPVVDNKGVWVKTSLKELAKVSSGHNMAKMCPSWTEYKQSMAYKTL